MSAECVYQSEAELWEDLLYFALANASDARRTLAQLTSQHHDSDTLRKKYRSACARAKLHLDNLAVREHLLPTLLVEMARAEGLL